MIGHNIDHGGSMIGLSRLFAIALLLLAAPGLTACTGEPELDQQPERVVQQKQLYYFEYIPTMAATSALVIRATVQKAEPGRWIGAQGAKDSDRARKIALRVDEVFYTTLGSPPATITLDEWGWDSGGQGYQVDGVTWTKPGDSGYYFLVPTPDVAGNYRLISTQGRILHSGQALASSADKRNPIYASVASLTQDALESTLRETERNVKSGKVKPKART